MTATLTAPPQLWPHQLAALDATERAIARGVQSGLWAMPTGTGKTLTFVELSRRLGWPTLILCHRDELIRQATGTVNRLWPEASVGVVQADRDGWHGADVVIASVPSLREASHLIDMAIEYKLCEPATGRQQLFLQYRGCWQDGMTKAEASVLIGQLKGVA